MMMVQPLVLGMHTYESIQILTKEQVEYLHGMIVTEMRTPTLSY